MTGESVMRYGKNKRDALRQQLLKQSCEVFSSSELESMHELATKLDENQSGDVQNQKNLNLKKMDCSKMGNRFAELFEHAPVGYVVLDADAVILQSNATWAEMVNRVNKKNRGERFAQFLHDGDVPAFLSFFQAVVRQNAEKKCLLRINSGNTTEFYAQITAKPLIIEGEKSPQSQYDLMLIISAVTTRDVHEYKVGHLNNLLKSIRDVNQIIVQEQDLNKIMQSACEILVNTPDCQNVEMALLDEKTGIIKPVANAGISQLQEWNITLGGQGIAPGCVQECLKTQKTVVVDDPEKFDSDCGFCNHSNKCKGLVIPVLQKQKLVGFLTIALCLEHTLFQEEVDLLEEIAGDLGYAREKNQVETALRESEKNYLEQSIILETTLNAIPDILGVQDLEHRIIRYNKAGYEFLGKSLDQVRGKKCFELIGRGKPCEICATSKVYRTKKPARVEKYVPDMSVWLDVRAYPVFDDKGKMIGIIEHLRDITERKAFEDDIRESEEKFRTLVEQTADGLLLHDLNGQILTVNQTSINQYGYSRDELQSMNVRDIDPEYDERENQGSFYEQMQFNKPVRFEARQKRKNGEIFPAEVTLTKVLLQNQIYIMGLCRDISQKKAAEQKILNSEQRLREAERIGRIGHVDWDVAEQKAYWSDEIFNIYERDAELGVPEYNEIMSLHRPKDAERLDKAVTNALEHGTPYELDLFSDLPSGARKYLHIIGRPMKNKEGKVIHIKGTVQDISERKRAEDQLIKLKDSLEQQVKDKTRELKERLHELERFHDATIEREFRMKELRNEIDQLRETLKKKE